MSKRMTLSEAVAHAMAGPVTKKAASTGPLDELRELLDGVDAMTVPVYRAGVDTALAIFSARHPGLVDLTVCGPQCPAWHEDGQDGDSCWCWAMVQYAPTGRPCPVIERRRDAARG